MIDAAQERGLARAAWPDDADDLASLHLHGDAAQHLVAVEILMHVLCIHHRTRPVGYPAITSKRSAHLISSLGIVCHLLCCHHRRRLTPLALESWLLHGRPSRCGRPTESRHALPPGTTIQERRVDFRQVETSLDLR